VKSALMWLYERRLISFGICESIALRLRRFRWFREG
jgi:hypothetical protein